MIELITSPFDDLIDERLQNINCSLLETRAYIKTTFTKYIKSDKALSNKGVTSLYIRACNEHDFAHFQNLADWLFFLKSVYPESLNSASQEYYNGLARTSYYKCYQMLNGKWPLFEEMADRFSYFVRNIKIISP